MNKPIMVTVAVLVLSGCGLNPSAAKCSSQYARAQAVADLAAVGTTTKAQIKAVVGEPVTDYDVVDPTSRAIVGTQLGYRVYEEGSDGSSCGFYFYSFDTAGILNDLSTTLSDGSTKVIKATDAWEQF